MADNARHNRRQQILECLASMLETHPGDRITTAALARHVGVSEAALYRHFPSKARMFEGLIEFLEDSVFTRIHRIRGEIDDGVEQCGNALLLLLTFTERNPGFGRLLTGDALSGETHRLRERIRQFFDRVETELRQILRDHEARTGVLLALAPAAAANLALACVEGRISQFVRSDFRRLPGEGWGEQWQVLAASLRDPRAAA